MADFPEHIASAWIGNTVKVARRHYLQVTEEAFRKALQNPVHSSHLTPTQIPPTEIGHLHQLELSF